LRRTEGSKATHQPHKGFFNAAEGGYLLSAFRKLYRYDSSKNVSGKEVKIVNTTGVVPQDKRMNEFLPRTTRTNTNLLLENHF